jgi:hypothetical protein
MNTDLYKKDGKKIVITTIFSDNKEYFIHKNIVINNETTINQYLQKIQSSIKRLYDSGYEFSTFPIIRIKLFILDNNNYNRKNGVKITNISPVYIQRRNFHNSFINLNSNLKVLDSIKPLKQPSLFKEFKKKLICTMDIETIDLNNQQYPIAISFSYYNENNELINIFKLINYKLLLSNFISERIISKLVTQL